MGALDRARQDEARGDLGAARRRLASAVGSGGYRPDLLARVGALSLRMKDPVEAGRYFYLSGELGTDVQDAVAAFAASCRGRAEHLASRLPRFQRREDEAQYPDLVRARLRAAGITGPLLAPEGRCPCCAPARRRERRLSSTVGCALVLLAIGIVAFLTSAALKLLSR